MMARGGDPTDDAARGHAVRLDREVIVGAAQRILDEEGLGALTMRRIGTELGADPTAVYRHFRDKDELVMELADRAFASIPVADPQLPWQERLRRQLHGALDLYRSNPDFASHLAHQPDDTPGLERIAEDALGIFADAGLDPRGRALAYQLMTNYAVGSGLFIGQLMLDDWGPETLPAVRRTYAALPPDEFPRCVESAPHLFPDQDEVYDLGVEMLIDAIEKLARSGARTKRAHRRATTKERP
jgi:AcrR family transcriptional regulator